MDESVQKHLTPALDSASKLLLKAANYIEEHGWCQGNLYDDRGRVCMVGALSAVALGSPSAIGATSPRYAEACRRLVGATKGHIGKWNDAQERTKDEVVAKLRAVALGG